MKLIKYLLFGVGGFVLLVLITLGVFLATFDANQYKQQLSDLVQQQTGRELTFDGDIGLSLYPSLGMNLGSMTLSNAKGFGDQPMLSVTRANASVDVLSILSFNPQIAQLVLEGLQVDLQKNKQGVSNWDDLTGKSQAAADDKPSDAKADTKQPVQISGSFGGLNITDANVSWKDAQAGVEYQVRNLSLITDEIELDKEFKLALEMELISRGQFETQVKLDSLAMLKGQNLSLSGLKLSTSAQGELIPVDKVDLSLDGDLGFTLDSNQLSFKGFSMRVDTQGGVLESSQVTLAGEVGFDLNKQHLTVAVLDLNADVAGETVPNKQMKVAFSTPQLDMKLEQRSIDMQNLVLMLNENQFDGFIKVLDYAQPAVNFKLSSKMLDVDKLTGWQPPPPQAELPANETTSNEPAPDVEIALPMELLRTLKIDGQLGIDRVIAQGLTLDNVQVSVKAADAVLDINPLSIDLYQGHFDGRVSINSKGDKPAYTVRKKLTTFQIGDFLKDFMQKDPVSGVAALEVDVKTRGDWLSQLKSNMNGKVNVAIKDGALSGFNLRSEIDQARAKLKGESLQQREVQKTDFSALSLSGVINNGVFSSDDLQLQAPLLRVGGAGKVNLVEESLDYLVRSKIVGTTKGQDAGTLNELTGLEIPVLLKGSWLQPEIDVQLDEMMKAKYNQEKARISEQVAREKAALQEKLAQEKAKLKASQQKKLDAQKAQLEKKKALAEAERKAQLEAKKKAKKEEAKKKLEDKLQKLF